MKKITTQAELYAALKANENAEVDLVSGNLVVSTVGNAAPLLCVRKGASLLVMAYDSSKPTIMAYDSSEPNVMAFDSSSPRIDAFDSSKPSIDARDTSQPLVVGWKNSTPRIVAWDNSLPSVEAHGSSKLCIGERNGDVPRIVELVRN